MTIEAKVILDSRNPSGKRLTTFLVRYPRFVHSEIMTHRMLSRNASSSRAIPVKTMLRAIMSEPAMPVHWGKNQAGMQALEELSAEQQEQAKTIWLEARDSAYHHTQRLVDLGIHKQVANRLIEPYTHITVLISATELENFFTLRWHPDAAPEFKELAEQMRLVYLDSVPQELDWYQWHIPFVSKEELAHYPLSVCIKFSVARCARVSYLNHDGTKPDLVKDIDLHDKLIIQKPAHASPAEHQAKAVPTGELGTDTANFRGFLQYRKTLVQECSFTFPEGFFKKETNIQ